MDKYRYLLVEKYVSVTLGIIEYYDSHLAAVILYSVAPVFIDLLSLG